MRASVHDGAASATPAVAVVIPALNEAESIAAVVAEIPRDVAAEIIVVDGGSCDGTPEAARAAGACVVVPEGRGYGRACAAGAAAADASCGIIVFMDGDGADPAISCAFWSSLHAAAPVISSSPPGAAAGAIRAR